MSNRVFKAGPAVDGVSELNLGYDTLTPTIVFNGTDHPTIYNGDIPADAHNEGVSGPNFVTSLILGTSCTSIGDNAFKWCNNLAMTNLIIPDSVTYIGVNAFTDSPLITGNIFIPDSVTFIGTGSFNQLGINGSITLSNNIESIGPSTFYGNNTITGDLIIPDSVKNIGSFAFRNPALPGQSKLQNELILGNSLESLGSNAFAGRGWSGNLDIPDTITSLNVNCFGENYFSSININIPAFGFGTFNNLTSLKYINVGTDHISGYDAAWRANNDIAASVEIRDLNKFHITWNSGGAPLAVIPLFNNEDLTAESVRYEWLWDSTGTTVTEGSNLLSPKFLGAGDVISEHWLQTTISDQTPSYTGLTTIDLNGSGAAVKSLDISQVRWPLKRIILEDVSNWIPEEPFMKVKIIDGFKNFTITNNPSLTELKFDLKGGADIRDNSSADNGVIKISGMSALTDISFSNPVKHWEDKSYDGLEVNTFEISNCNALTGTLDLRQITVDVNPADTPTAAPPTPLTEFVTIRDAGNAVDAPQEPQNVGYGDVSYVYQIGRYTISEGDIATYNAAPVNSTRQITLDNRGTDKPATISWNEAARYINWLNIREGFQPAYKFDTGGVNDNISLWAVADSWTAGGENRYRHKYTTYFLPSENEWYKAAYYDSQADVYYTYATGSDTLPTPTAGSTITGEAVYAQPGGQGPADVNNAGGLSPYGTMGQGGNVYEWIESALFSTLQGTNDPATEARGVRGGSWVSDPPNQSNFRSGNNPDSEIFSNGFRVAKVYDRFTSEFGMNLTDNTGITSLALGSGYNTKHTLNLRGCTNLTGFYPLDPKTLTISGVNDWSDCNFSEGSLLDISQFVKGDPEKEAYQNRVKLHGNPIWDDELLDLATIENALANNFIFAGATYVIYRINCGGPLATSIDNYMDWEADNTINTTYLTAASNNIFTPGGTPTYTFDSSVPTSTPEEVIHTERYDEMTYNFPVSNGEYEVRLYFAELFNGITSAGQRLFQVKINGVTKLLDFDRFAEAGSILYKGITKSFNISTNNELLTIEFINNVENCAINAIEIIDLN